MDHPFYEIVESAERAIRQGGIIYQKFTCRCCGQRLTMETPNTLHKVGYCEECGTETDIVASGCNYLLVLDRRDSD